MIEGGCFCKYIRYEIDDGVYQSIDCHCTMCRHAHSAPFVTWIIVPTVKHRYVREQPTLLQSSEHGRRFFCSRCGTHVACDNSEHPGIIDIPVGSLDEPNQFEPTKQIFVDTRLPWVSADV